MKTVLLIVVLCLCVSSIAGQLGLAAGIGSIAGPLLALGLLGSLAGGLGGNRGSGQSFLLYPQQRQQTYAQHRPLAYYGRPYFIPSKFCNKENCAVNLVLLSDTSRYFRLVILRLIICILLKSRHVYLNGLF